MVVLAALLGAVLVGGLLRVRVDTGVESFLPAKDPTLAAVQRKASDFGGDPVIVLLRYPTDRQFLTDHDQLLSLLKTEGQLGKLPDVATVYGPATVLNQLAGAAQKFIAQIGIDRDDLRQAAQQTTQQAGKPPAEVTAAGDAAVAEFDLRYAALLVRGMPVGLPTLRNPKFTTGVIFGPDGQAKPQWRFIVPTPDTVAILVRPRQDLDPEGVDQLVEAIRKTVSDAGLTTSSVTVSGVPVVTAALTSEIAKEAPLIAGLVALVVLIRFLLLPLPGAAAWRDSRRQWLATRLRPLAATLLGGAATLALFGWSGFRLSFAAVLLLPLLLGVGSSFPLYLATLPDRRRVLVMSAGSALAFLALALSPLTFVRDLGFALSAGVVLTVATALLLGARRAPESPAPESPLPSTDVPGPSRTVSVVVLVAVSAVAVLGWAVLPNLAVQANPQSLARGLPAVLDAQSVESVLGASGEISVELRGPDVVSPPALGWARDASIALTASVGDKLRPVVSTSSLLAFLGESPTAEQVTAALDLLPPYLSSSVIRPDRQAALLVYGVRLQDLGEQQVMLDQARAALPAPPAGFEVDVVGLPVAATRGYALINADRYLANLAGIVAATLVLGLGLGLRSRDAGRAVAAATLATGWGLAALWSFGVALSPLTVALGSLVTVTGCEFVVLLSLVPHQSGSWLSRSVAYAAGTSVAGYLALAVSKLWLIREFGVVLGAAVMLSYLAARLVVWLDQARPAGRRSRARPAARTCRGWARSPWADADGDPFGPWRAGQTVVAT